MSKKITCPRRMEEMGPWKREEGLDQYKRGGGLVGQARACSFCGSMPPEDFMQAVREGKEVGPTDKNYKAYVGAHEGKFYYQHLSEEQRKEFIALLNEKKVSIGYPGYFYVLPFFVSYEATEESRR